MSNTIPSEIYQGNSGIWSVSNPNYSPIDGWAATLRLVGPATLDIVGAANGDDFDLILSPIDSATLLPGDYQFFITFTKGATDKKTDETGRIVVKKDPAALAAGDDPRSAAERSLANVTAVIEKRATTDVLNYSINGRALSHHSIDELLKLQESLRRQVETERAESDGSAIVGGHVHTRFK